MTLFDSYEGDQTVAEAHERRIKRCTSCRAKIIWFKTVNNRWTPVDADTVQATDTELDMTRHISHFATCSHSTEHRKPRK